MKNKFEQSITEATRMAQLCRRAREEHTGVAGLLNEVEYLIDGNVIAVRGTEINPLTGGLSDVIRDLRIMPWHDERIGWAHAGMLKAAQDIYKQIEPRILRKHVLSRFDGHQIVSVTGHSLGAGIGFLLAMMLNQAGCLVNFTGFGSPRPMISKNRHTRMPVFFYSHADDPVTKVPRWWMGGYRKNPNEMMLPGSGHGIDKYISSLKRWK